MQEYIVRSLVKIRWLVHDASLLVTSGLVASHNGPTANRGSLLKASL
jgi:hypothetical protein